MRILPEMPLNLPEYLTCAQVAKMFGTSRSAVRKWHQAGKFPSPVILSPRVHLYPTRAIRRYLAEMLLALQAEASGMAPVSGGPAAPPQPFPPPGDGSTPAAG